MIERNVTTLDSILYISNLILTLSLFLLVSLLLLPLGQGVLMINTVMTVRKSDANSHKNKGWEAVTDEIIRTVAKRERGAVFLLWGKPAATKAQSIVGSSKRHVVISTSHPSPLGATKTSSPFTGSGCFSLANEALKEMGYDEIDWRVDGEL
jgi:uracil-DNA glycosylase